MLKILFLSLFAISFAFSKPIVVTSIAPVAFFVEQIAKDSVEVISLAYGDVHSYEPKPNDMKNISKAKIYFTSGLEFENVWLPKFQANAKDLIVVKADAKIAKLQYNNHDEHDEHDEHKHEGTDPHIWLNPMLALTMCRNITDALIDNFSENKNMYLKNFQDFMDKVIEFDTLAKEQLQNIKNRKFIVYHPAWSYFAMHYNLEQISIEKDGKEPKINELTNTLKLIKDENIKVIFADPNHSVQSAKILAQQSKARLEFLDPLAKNWLENLNNAVQAIKNAD